MNSSLNSKRLFVITYAESQKKSELFDLNKGLNSIWTIVEDNKLTSLIQDSIPSDWDVIAQNFEYKNALQCKNRWYQKLKPGLVKGPWTKEEDQLLFQWINSKGPRQWAKCGRTIIGRSGKQCRERWFNCLNPEVVIGKWTPEEDYLIFKLYINHGSKWAKIIEYFPGRTENSIKNRFYSTLRRIGTKKNKGRGIKHSLLKIQELLVYLPQAIEEKERLYKKKLKKKLHALDKLKISKAADFEVLAEETKKPIANEIEFPSIVNPNIYFNFYYNPNISSYHNSLYQNIPNCYSGTTPFIYPILQQPYTYGESIRFNVGNPEIYK